MHWLHKQVHGGRAGVWKGLAREDCLKNIEWYARGKYDEDERALRSAPVVRSVADIPEATPLLVTGVAFMMELMFGAKNIPPPTPLMTMSRARTL